MHKPWLIQYPPGVPAEIDTRQFASLKDALAAGRAQVFDEVALGHDDLVFLQYTGGTTGVAKGTMLSDGNMVANVLQVAAWMSPNLHDGEETVVIPLPPSRGTCLRASDRTQPARDSRTGPFIPGWSRHPRSSPVSP